MDLNSELSTKESFRRRCGGCRVPAIEIRKAKSVADADADG